MIIDKGTCLNVKKHYIIQDKIYNIHTLPLVNSKLLKKNPFRDSETGSEGVLIIYAYFIG